MPKARSPKSPKGNGRGKKDRPVILSPALARIRAMGRLIFGRPPLDEVAATYYVAPTSQGNGTGSSAENAAALSTFNHAGLSPGDVVELTAGSYTSALIPAASGTSGNPITYRGPTGGGAVFTHPNQDGLDTAIVVNTGLSYIVIDGLEADGVSARPAGKLKHFVDLNGATYITVKNCTFEYCNGWEGIQLSDASYCTIQDCTIGWVGIFAEEDNASYDVGDAIEGRFGTTTPHHCLIDGCYIHHAGHDGIRLEGQHNVVRNCVIDGDWTDWPDAVQQVLDRYNTEPVGTVVKDPSPAGTRCADIGGQYNVFEGNLLINTGVPPDTTASPAAKVRGEFTIARHNVVWNAYQMCFQFPDRPDPIPHARMLRVYNNTFHTMGAGGGFFRYTGNGSIDGNRFFNNLLETVRQNPNSSAFNTDGASFEYGALYATLDAADFEFRNNMSSSATPNFNRSSAGGIANWSVLDQAPPTGLDGFSDNTGGASNSFQDASTPESVSDFTLQAGSDAIGAAGWLTTVTADSDTATFEVGDTYFFSDGHGIVDADTITIEGIGAVTIVSINHGASTITVDQPVSVTTGDGVRFGTSSNIGAV